MPRNKVDRKDWHNLPYDKWNTATVLQMFADLNREHYDVETYLPMRNWAAERGMIKRALDEYGAELLHEAFTQIFREYRPNEQYPILTAGFAISYRLNTVMPRLLVDRQRQERAKQADDTANNGMTAAELAEWL
ncbi:hypothetical protein M3231_15410 [Neobacillus mesonae]|nr:hypothetical protein [Neobacillus mesonae]